MPTVIEELAKYSLDANLADVPRHTQEFTKELLLKLVTNMVVGSSEPTGNIIARYLRERRGAELAGVVGVGFRTSAAAAALANGTFARACELNDDQFPADASVVYVWPALFAVAEQRRLSGRELLQAVIASWEVETGLCSGHDAALLAGFGIGFGPMAIAAGLARPLGLSLEQTVNAMSIGASQYFGLMKQAGTDAPNLEAGLACRAGVEVVELAEAGATGRPDILEGPRGLFSLIPGYDASQVTAHLGTAPHDVHRMWIKKYPCCFILHREIDAMKMLLQEHRFLPENVKRVTVEVNKIDALVCDRPLERPGDAQFSFHHTLAAALLDGDVDVSTFSDAKVQAPAYTAMRRRVEVKVRPDWPDGFFAATSITTVETHDGRRFTKDLRQPVGGTERPLTRAEMSALYHRYTKGTLADVPRRRIEEIILTLEEQPDVLELMRLLTFVTAP